MWTAANFIIDSRTRPQVVHRWLRSKCNKFVHVVVKATVQSNYFRLVE